MSGAEGTRVITSRTIKTMSEHYDDVADGFWQSRRRLPYTALMDAFGPLFQDAQNAYELARHHCDTTLDQGFHAAEDISNVLTTCARNWSAAEQANIVEYR